MIDFGTKLSKITLEGKMKALLKKIKAWSLIEAVISIVFGILFIACPSFTKSTICYLFASLIVVMGLIKCANYFSYGIEPFGFIRGIVDITLGVIVFSTIPTLIEGGIFGFVFGVIFIVKSLFSLEWAVDCKRVGIKNWWLVLLLSLVILGCGIALVCVRSMENVLIIVLGVVIILQGIYDLVDTLVISAKVKKAKKSIKEYFAPLKDFENIESIEEAHVIDDPDEK